MISNRCPKLLFALLIGMGLAMTSSYAVAQDAVSGSISGTVTDSSGALIHDATVTLTNTDRGEDIRVLKTNAAGFYTARSLPLGTYTVKISNPGFKTDVVTGLSCMSAMP